MSVFDNIKEAIIEFVHDNVINERTGRLITRKVNKCVLDHFESDNYKMIKTKYNSLKKENRKMRKLIQRLHEEKENYKKKIHNLREEYCKETVNQCNLEREVMSLHLENNELNDKLNRTWFNKFCRFIYLAIKYYLLGTFWISLLLFFIQMFI